MLTTSPLLETSVFSLGAKSEAGYWDSVHALVVWRGEGKGELSRSRVQSLLESRASSCPRVLSRDLPRLVPPDWGWRGGRYPQGRGNPGFRSVSQAGVLLWSLYFHRLSQRSRSCSLLPLFLPTHILTLLIQKRKNIRAQRTSVSFPSRARGKCSGSCPCLGVEDRVGSGDMPLLTPQSLWIFPRVPGLKFIALAAHRRFPCVLPTFLYFAGNWERAPLGDALTHGRVGCSLSLLSCLACSNACETLQSKSRPAEPARS